MIPQLEQMARNLAEAKVRESIDLQSDLLDAYYNTVSLGIKTLVSGEYAKVENVLYGMTSINWATFDNIGDQSGRVCEFDRIYGMFPRFPRRCVTNIRTFETCSLGFTSGTSVIAWRCSSCLVSWTV